MEEKGKKIKLTTIICLVVILLLVVALVCMWFYYQPKQVIEQGKQNMNTAIQDSNRQDSTSINIIKNEQDNVTKESNDVINETNPNNTEEDLYSIKGTKKEIKLNGKNYIVEINYSVDEKTTYEDEGILGRNMQIKLNSKVVKEKWVFYNKDGKITNGIKEITSIKGSDDTDYLVIHTNYTTDVLHSDEDIFYFINTNGEIINSIKKYQGTSITIDGKTVSYELGKDNFVWYAYNFQEEIQVVKYQLKIVNDASDIRVLKTYKSSEIELAGAV